jgi:hypothetical protein
VNDRIGEAPDPKKARSGPRESWLAGLTLGAAGGFLMLEFPLLGLAICLATAIVLWRLGSAMAGAGGLFVGIGAMWLLLFGHVALDCRGEAGCTAPNIGSAVATSAGVLAIGVVLSAFAALQSRRN